MVFQASIIAQKMQFGLQNFILLAIPLFILAAKLMNTAGITQKIFGFADTLVGFLPGGLAHANVVASLIFAGMSGAAVVDAAGLGQIELMPWRRAGTQGVCGSGKPPRVPPSGRSFRPVCPWLYFPLSAVCRWTSFSRRCCSGYSNDGYSYDYGCGLFKKEQMTPGSPFPPGRLPQGVSGCPAAAFYSVYSAGGIWLGFVTPTEAARLRYVMPSS